MHLRSLAFLAGTLGLSVLLPSSLSAQLPTTNIVVANRGDGTLSVIDTTIDQVVRTITLPSVIGTPEPMGVIATPQNQLFWVTDRGQNAIWAFNSRNYMPLEVFAVGAGPGHTHSDPAGKALWVVNETSKSMSIFRARTLQFVKTIPIPAALAEVGGFPHDVYISNNGELAYVAIHGLPGGSDVVLSYGAQGGALQQRRFVGDGPHVAFSRGHVFVPCEGSDLVYVLDADTLDIETTLAVPSPHGATISPDKNRFYTTNIAGGGVDAIWVISTQTLSIIGGPTNSPSPQPDSVTVEENLGRRLYCTHSAGNTVSIYRSSPTNPDPLFLKELTVGLNPHGLDYAP